MADSEKNSASAFTSTAQPGSTVESFQSLQMIRSKQSAKISIFELIVSNPWKDTYEYQWEGKPRETTVWRCVLVSADDPTEYCNGEYKLTAKNKSSFEKHVKVQTLPLTLFVADAELITMLEFADKAISDQVPVSFFNVRGANIQHQDAFTFTSARKGFSMIVAESPQKLRT